MSNKELKQYKKLIDRLDNVSTLLLDAGKRLDAIIGVLLETARLQGKKMPIVDRIIILHNAGLRPVEISKILAISLSHVSVELARIRKTQKARR